MMRITGFRCTLLAAIAPLAACSDAPSLDAGESDADSETLVEALARPDPGSCPPPQHAYNEDEFGPRTDPLIIAAEFANIAATDQTNIAVTTLGGGQVCQDASWLFNLGDGQMLQGERFLALPWGAFEAFGTFLFDRSGGGQVVEVGELPVFSPSSARMAALQITQSGFGGLESLAVWQVERTGLREIFRLPDEHNLAWTFQDYDDFRIDRWAGEDCLNIGAVAYKDAEASGFDWDKAQRTPFHAREADGWKITPGGC